MPEFIGARPVDLRELVTGLLAANAKMGDGNLDPVLQAAATAFGFVHIHPFDIDWRPTERHNVEVLNDTADLYRYFDATDNAEFLYPCVERTVDHDLPREIEYLGRRDEAIRRIMDIVDLPDRLAEDVLTFVRQNRGVFPQRRRQNEFAALSEDEVRALETAVNEAFEGF